MDDVSQPAPARIRGGIGKTNSWDQSLATIRMLCKLAHLKHNLLVIVQLVGSHGRASLQNRRHIMEPLLSLLRLVPIHRPPKVSRIDVCGKSVSMLDGVDTIDKRD
jgi:hypothetical protein